MKLFYLSLSLLFALHASAFNVYVIPTPDPCGNGTGKATAYANSGAAPYDFIWSNGETTPTINGLAAGWYYVSVTDDLGAVVEDSVEIHTGAGLNVLTVEHPQFPDCFFSCSGQIALDLSQLGGQAPYIVTAEPPAFVSWTDSTTWAYIDGICEGLQAEVMVTDDLGCTSGQHFLQALYTLGYTIPLDEQVTGTCPGYDNGSVSLEYDPFVLDFGATVEITGPGGSVPNVDVQGAFVTADGLEAGNYTVDVFAWDPFICTEPHVFVVPELQNDCGELNGAAYVDLDQDCIQDLGEPGVPFRPLVVQPGNVIRLTSADGTFSVGLDYNSYTLEQSSSDFEQLCPAANPYPFALSNGTPTHTVELADTALGELDVRITTAGTQAVPGFEQRHWVHVVNDSPFPTGQVTILFEHDALFTLISTSETPLITTATSITWQLADLEPFVTHTYMVDLQIPPDPLLIGTNRLATATVSTIVPDGDLSNNTMQNNYMVVGAFDPNDKTARTTTGNSDIYLLGNDEDITYTIRFQNTGNAPAQNVFILDTLSPFLDMLSIEILGASHSFNASYGDERVLRFDFPNIQLPDSVNDEPNSHGFVSYRIKPVPGIAVGNWIENTAGIYFDFNPVVETNTSVVEVEGTTVGIVEQNGSNIQLVPNPASSDVLVQGLTSAIARAQLYSVDGRIHQLPNIEAGQGRFDLSSVANGVYIFELELTNGELLKTRLVKQ